MNRDAPIDITSRHGHVSARMEEYATKKCERLLRFFDRITRIEVIADGPHEAPEVEIIVHAEHAGPFVAREKHDHFSQAIDSLTNKLERQLVKAKEKLVQKHHKHESIRDIPDPNAVDQDVEDSFEDAIRKKLDS